MPRVDSSSEDPSHLRKPISFFPYLAEIIIGPGCTHPFSEAASPESEGVSWRSIEP
jgi:hypothetical protein